MKRLHSKLRRRYGRATAGASGMTPEQHAVILAALQHYGAGLADTGFISRGEKVLGVRPEVRKGRLRMVTATGQLLASFPAAHIATGIAEFVERFWYWKPGGA